jgi:hypothetical protein
MSPETSNEIILREHKGEFEAKLDRKNLEEQERLRKESAARHQSWDALCNAMPRALRALAVDDSGRKYDPKRPPEAFSGSTDAWVVAALHRTCWLYAEFRRDGATWFPAANYAVWAEPGLQLSDAPRPPAYDPANNAYVLCKTLDRALYTCKEIADARGAPTIPPAERQQVDKTIEPPAGPLAAPPLTSQTIEYYDDTALDDDQAAALADCHAQEEAYQEVLARRWAGGARPLTERNAPRLDEVPDPAWLSDQSALDACRDQGRSWDDRSADRDKPAGNMRATSLASAHKETVAGAGSDSGRAVDPLGSHSLGDELVPGYYLTSFLGRGGFGQVWEALGPGGVNVALKIISLEGGEGLKEFRAISLVKKLRNPNLVPLHGCWLRDESGLFHDPDAAISTQWRGGSKTLIIAMGLGEKNLAQRLAECRRQGRDGIPTEELLDYMADAARAIDYLNQPIHVLDAGPRAAIIHCDIKPANLLIVGNGVQVCDYGLARALTNDARTTQFAGTPVYSAPELFVNKPSPRTDQYSLAVTYYELRTGRLPFAEHEAIQAHITGSLDLLLLRPAEREVIRRATHLRPDDRYPSTWDMVAALRKAAHS